MMIPATAANEIPTGLGALGVDYRIDCSGGSTNGQTIDCDSWGNFFNETCWGWCSADVIAAGGTAPSGSGGGTPPPLAPTGVCSLLPSLCDATGAMSLPVIAGLGAAGIGLAWLFFGRK